MLLQQIVASFDEELRRLYGLREIVAGLAGTSVPDLDTKRTSGADISAAVERALPAQASSVAEPKRRRVLPREREAVVRKARREPEPTALSGAIPSAPVVITAEALAKQASRSPRTPAKAATPKPEPGSLGSMIRALRLEASS